MKMMFQLEDWKTLQTLVTNYTITQDLQQTPQLPLETIQTRIKEDEYFWHYRDQLVSDVRQKPNEFLHTLNTHVLQLINNCHLTNNDAKETLKIMQLNTRRQVIGHGNNINRPSHTTNSQHTARPLNHDANKYQKAKEKG